MLTKALISKQNQHSRFLTGKKHMKHETQKTLGALKAHAAELFSNSAEIRLYQREIEELAQACLFSPMGCAQTSNCSLCFLYVGHVIIGLVL